MQLNCGCITSIWLAFKNSHFSSLLAAWDVSRGGTSVFQRQRFHTDDINQYLHDKFGSHGVSNANIISILHFSWSILVKCCVHLWMSSSSTQMLLLEKYIYHKFWLLCYRFIALYLTLASFCLMSVICKQWLEQCNYSNIQSVLMTGFRTDFKSSVWNFCPWVQDVPPGKMSPSSDEQGETSVFAVYKVTRGQGFGV